MRCSPSRADARRSGSFSTSSETPDGSSVTWWHASVLLYLQDLEYLSPLDVVVYASGVIPQETVWDVSPE